jgi:hypothetical protein
MKPDKCPLILGPFVTTLIAGSAVGFPFAADPITFIATLIATAVVGFPFVADPIEVIATLIAAVVGFPFVAISITFIAITIAGLIVDFGAYKVSSFGFRSRPEDRIGSSTAPLIIDPAGIINAPC